MLASRGLTAPQRIDRCVSTLASHPVALDILLNSLRKAYEQPSVERFRKVPVENPTFKRTVGQAPSGTELLFACGYEPMYGHLVLQKWDAALLTRAIDGLQRAKQGEAYLEAAERLNAAKASAEAAAGLRDAARRQRASYAVLVPKEPDPAAAEVTSCVHINVQTEGGTKVASRRFDSEDTLRNLLDYVRSLETTPLGSRLVLQNVTTAPFAELDLDRCLDSSLYSLDLWPVSHVRVVAAAA